MKRVGKSRPATPVDDTEPQAARAEDQLDALTQILEAMDAPNGAQSLEKILQVVVDSAVRLCAADSGSIVAVENGQLQELAFTRTQFRDEAAYRAARKATALPVDRTTLTGRVLQEGRSVRIADIQSEPGFVVRQMPGLAAGGDDPLGQGRVNRSVLGVPLRRQDEILGVLVLRRVEVAPFSDEELATVETFARPAAVAIQNARLFKETEEALEQQTATSDVLRVISRSAFDLGAVLQTLVERAVALGAAENGTIARLDGAELRMVASAPAPYQPKLAEDMGQAGSEIRIPVDRGSLSGRAVLDRRTVHVADLRADAEYTIEVTYSTGLAVPLLRGDEVLGVFMLRRASVSPFTERQIQLVETFADQAAIAIENVRLFNETKEALERQTAIAEVLRAIGRSSFDLDDVLDTVLSRAATLVAADLGSIYRRVGDGMRLDARFPSDFPTASMNEIARDGLTALVNYAGIENEQGRPSAVPKNDVATAIAFREGRTVHVPDVPASAEFATWEVEPKLQWYTALTRRLGIRAELAVPLKRDDQILGIIDLVRAEPKPFTPDEIALLETFADQASIAIDSVRMFNEIQEKSAQLAEASRHKSEFLANMSHELRTPLNAIIGFSDVLLEGMSGALDDRQREYVADIKSSGEHQLSLINDILDLSKVEAGRMELEVSEFELSAVVEGAVALVKERATRRGVSLSVDVPETDVVVQADQRKIKQVLLNLLSNAVKFTPEGGWVGVTAKVIDGVVQVSVRDTGIGIASEDRERVFEEFRQAGAISPQRPREGTGLGLALSKRFAELHGGRLWLESEVGKGSSFTLEVPLRRPAAHPVGA